MNYKRAVGSQLSAISQSWLLVFTQSSVPVVAILRLRDCFADARNPSAQDDKDKDEDENDEA